MTTKYFILSKNPQTATYNNDENQIIFLNTRLNYILPQVNLEYYSKYGLFENGLIEWCKQFCRKDKIFLDIGAHSGTYAISLAGHCKEVHAFEPQRLTYYSLCGSIALSNSSNIFAHKVGLGSIEQTGSQLLSIVSNDGGGSSLHNNSHQPVLEKETIEIRTIDSFEFDNIGFIKMDVEDNELFVLQGSKATLTLCSYPPFMFESNNQNNNKVLFDYIKLVLGYKIVQIGGCNNMFLATKT
jgi:FkbM family methyltransferase